LLNWNAAREAIRLAVVAATGIPDGVQVDGSTSTRVHWINTSTAGTFQPWPQAKLRARRVKSWDDSIIPEVVGYNGPVHYGPRAILVEIRIESDNQNSAESPGDLSEYLRTRIFRGKILAALKVAGIGVGEISETVEADFQSPEGRFVSVGITEIWFNLAQLDGDETDDGYDIGSVTIVSDTIQNVDGSDSPAQFDITVTKP
jgi:hypothetical protein